MQRNRRLPVPMELRHFLHRVFTTVQHEARIFGRAVRPTIEPYAAWLNVNVDNARAAAHIRDALATTPGQLHRISVVMPVYAPAEEVLEAAIRSVLAQRYENWELCIADDASPTDRVREILQHWSKREARIKVVCRSENGNISVATNTAASLATGEFLLFLDQDDELHPDCLAEIALRVAEGADVDMLYTDDDKIGPGGHRFDPQFKPDWSPELLLSYMYISHALVVRHELFRALGGFRVGYEGSQDYDFALRAAERARAVAHVPRVLYHWRALPSSTASSAGAKPGSIDAGLRAVGDALVRRGIPAAAYQPDWARKQVVGIYAHRFPDDGPTVTLIIPTKNQHALLDRCLRSINTTTYRNYSILVIDNESDDAESIRYLGTLQHRVLKIPNPGPSFNFSYINNRATELVDSEFVLFLNNDTEVIEPRWLSQMVGYAKIPGVGAVGARLLYPDDRIQHAGIVHGVDQGMAGPAFKQLPSWHGGYLSYTRVARDYMAVTAACMLTPRAMFLSFGGFDERDFAVAYNDVDYCYRLVSRGYRCVYCPDAELRHHENYSRGQGDDPCEEAAFKRKYRKLRDPWYNMNLSLDNERFQIRPLRAVLHSLPPVRVLFYSHNLKLEGAPNSAYELTAGLRDAGVVQPIVVSPVDGPLRRAYEERGITVRLVDLPVWEIDTDHLHEKQVRTLTHIIRSLQVDVVHANTLFASPAIDAARQLSVPAIWNLHESDPWQDGSIYLGSSLERRVLNCLQYPYRVVFVAEATRQGWEIFNTHHNFTVIHNGLNIDRLDQQRQRWSCDRARATLGVSPSDVVILLLGTVCERKGQLDLVHALQHAPLDAEERGKFFFVGDRPGHYSDRLHAEVTRLPAALRQRVSIVGETEETGLYYSSADIFVCTSRIESFPRVTLEAMAHGLPIVTTPVYGIAEQVREGVNAMFYPPGDTQALADRLTTMIADSDLRRTFAEKSGPMLDRLNSFEDMVDRYADVFRQAYLSAPAG